MALANDDLSLTVHKSEQVVAITLCAQEQRRWQPSKRRGPQPTQVTFTEFSRRNNLPGDLFANPLRDTGILERLAGSLESFSHRRNQLGFEYSRRDE
jgi:hypothetical protein